MENFSGPCPVCGGDDFRASIVLWPELINAWQLSSCEVEYINRQQGFYCSRCNNNLRAMALAAAILSEFNLSASLEQSFVADLDLKILEINRAGYLTQYLSRAYSHRLVEYPEFDMMNLDIESESFDLVVHSDTLEHVNKPERALNECRRILRRNGRCIYTIPIIIDRMTRSRSGLPPSYHGRSGIPADDQQVFTEFGSDFWKIVLKAGFKSCEIVALEYPAGLAIVAKK